MFLATTALSEFWDKNQEILFLGSWCCRYDRQRDWQGLKFRVMPTIWNDRRRFYEAARYLDDFGERMIICLTDYLNHVHGQSFGKRYWRILVGPWLFRYMHAAYDRYALLEAAFKEDPDLQTILLDPGSFRVPWDTREFMNLYIDDFYNLQIFSQLLIGMGYQFPERLLPAHWRQVESETATPKEQMRLKRWITRPLDRAWEAISRVLWGRCPVALYNMHCPRFTLWPLIYKMGFRALPLHLNREYLHALRVAPSLDERRKGLGRIPFSGEFERLFVRSLPQEFPILYLEGLQTVRSALLKRYPRAPRVLVSILRWYTDETFKFLAAEAAEKGSRIVAVEHAGGYGFMRFHPEKLHEQRVGDPFIACGWTDEKSGNAKNLPSIFSSPLLESRSHDSKHKPLKTILFITTMQPRYLHKFQSCPVAGQWEEYLDWQMRFLAAVPAWLRSSILFRPYMEDYGFGVRERLLKRFGDIKWDDSVKIVFRRRLKDARLTVVDYAGSTFVESLSSNVPTVSYWNFERWEAPEEAESYFDGLREAGIFWDTPEEAAVKVTAIYENPWRWWGSEPVQQARRRFLDRFALAREDWSDQWASALEQVLAFKQKGEPESACVSEPFVAFKS